MEYMLLKTPKEINLLIFDGSILIIDAMENLFKHNNQVNIVANCTSPIKALSIIEKKQVDVLLIDVLMENIDAIEVIKLIKGCYPKIKVIAFSHINNDGFIKDFKELEVDGFISKFYAGKESILNEIHRVTKE